MPLPMPGHPRRVRLLDGRPTYYSLRDAAGTLHTDSDMCVLVARVVRINRRLGKPA